VTVLALLCAAAAAGQGARAAAAFVPAHVNAALLLEGAQATAGLRAFFAGVELRAPALAPGARLAALVGPDLVDDPLSWGIAPSGPRAVVFEGGAAGSSAPVRDGRAARSSLRSWLAQVGAPRPLRLPHLRGAFVSGDGRRTRAGVVATLGGAQRLLTASGADAAALLTRLAQTAARSAGASPLSGDGSLRAALARLGGPAGLVARGAEPVHSAVLSLEGSAQGLVARGLLVARAPLLAGAAPGLDACAGAALLCLRAGLGPAGRATLAAAARAWLGILLEPSAREGVDRLAQRAAVVAERLVVRSSGVDSRLLASESGPAWAARVEAVTVPPPERGSAEVDGPRSVCVRADATAAWFGIPCPERPSADPRASDAEEALGAQLDLGLLDAALQRLTPLDALRGGLPAGLYAARLTVGGMLRGSGPVTATGQPHPSGAEVEVRWPLR
jgi:hypothetical protein